jgi:ribosomal protein S18 acetylase RimI-like enzyme
MLVEARHATAEDLPGLIGLYRGLEEEMVALHPMWPLADGLPEPIEDSLGTLVDDDEVLVVLGLIDDYPLGFMTGTIENLLPQADGARLGVIRMVWVDHEARQVGLGEVMRDMVLSALRDQGISRFDAHVLPGHRLAKNYFESGGFSARSIVMHHDDDR